MGYKQLTVDELKEKADTLATDDFGHFLEEQIETLFSVSAFTKYYTILKDVKIDQIKTCMPRLIVAWLAFLSGDHSTCFNLIKKMIETDLVSAEESSLFYSLKALLSGMTNTDDAIRYATLSIDVLNPQEKTIYMGNALLTYGQIYSGIDEYHKASDKFSASYEVFYAIDLDFLASTAFVNMAINLYKIGKYPKVIEKCQVMLLKESNANNGINSHWNIVHLPLGLCYYELGKANLAVEQLKHAKDAIDSLGLIHMHGMVELYLFKSYFVLNDKDGMETVKNEMINRFSKMNYPTMNLIIVMFTIYSSVNNLDQHQSMIEKLEAEYLKENQDSYSVIFELLVYLKLNNKSDVITVNKLIDRLEHFKKINNISMIQFTALQLTELYMSLQNTKQANHFLRTAIEIFQEYSICANFFLLPLTSINHIKEQDDGLYNRLIKSEEIKKHVTAKENALLTERERDIILLIAKGKTNKEISSELFISVGTIKWHINNIFSKLHVKNRIKAVEKAKELNEI